MANWLQKLLKGAEKPGKSAGAAAKVPVRAAQKQLNPQVRRTQNIKQSGLPNATIVYGIGASFLFVAALFLLFKGRWFTALEVFVLGIGLLGFALHLLKHQD